MDFFNHKGEAIADLDAWERLAPPAAADHWVEGRSAYEVARDWVDGNAANRMATVLSLRPELSDLELSRAVVEKRTRFDDIRGGPRHHDLLLTGTTDTGPIVVGVEGKADETFDLTLEKFVETARARTERTRAPVRLDRLTLAFFGKTWDEDAAVAGLRYQLISALAGTLADAQATSAAHAVLMIHEFVTDKTEDELHARNSDDLAAFIDRLMGADAQRVGDADGWLTGPAIVKGDGTWLPSESQVFVGKLTTRRR